MSKPKFKIWPMRPHSTLGVRVMLQPINKAAQDLWEDDDLALVRYAEEIKQERLNKSS